MTSTSDLTSARVALLDEWVDSFNSRDLERHLALLTEDFSYRLPRFAVTGQGLDEHRKTLDGFIAAVPDRTITLIRTIVADDEAAVIYRYAGTSAGLIPDLPPAGEWFLLEVCAILRFRDNQISDQIDYC